MKPIFFVLFFLIIVAACSNRDKLPPGILPRQKMQAVLWDMIQAGEFLNGYVLFRDTFTKAAQESLKWYDKVYAIHGVNRADFERSYVYYRQHPVIMKELLDSLARLPQIAPKRDSTARRDSSTGGRKFDTTNRQPRLQPLTPGEAADTARLRRSLLQRKRPPVVQ